MTNRIDSPEYWIEDFKPTVEELDALYAQVLEHLRPVEIDQLARALVRVRVERHMAARRSNRAGEGVLYQPADRYEVGQKLIFPALGGLLGVVEAVRPGNNPHYGGYEVIGLQLDGERREFAAGIAWAHSLAEADVDIDPEVLAERFGPIVAPQLAALLAKDRDWIAYADHWVLRALLPEINSGHCNLTEAVLMLAGEPLPAEQILEELELDEGIPVETRALALDMALAADDRFRNVGALEAPLWTLAQQS
jgi:hypothetical protein